MTRIKISGKGEGRLVLCLLFGVLLGSCAPDFESKYEVSIQIPNLRHENHFQVLVETPAGAHNQILWNHDLQKFDTIDLQFQSNILSPVNFGFFPILTDTLIKVPVWIFSKQLGAGDTLTVNLLGLLQYTVGGNSRQEIVATPTESQLQTVKSMEFEDFIIENDPLKFAFEYWLKNRDGLGEVSRIKWDDKAAAQAYLDKCLEHSGVD